MKKIDLTQIKKLRNKTQVGVMDCRQALEECAGDFTKAQEWLRKKGVVVAKKRADRETGSGIVEAYTHADSRVAAVVELACETDFVAKNKDFKNLAHELVLQVAAMAPKDAAALLKQTYIRDDKITMEELIKQAIAKFGENIVIRRIFRCKLGE